MLRHLKMQLDNNAKESQDQQGEAINADKQNEAAADEAIAPDANVQNDAIDELSTPANDVVQTMPQDGQYELNHTLTLSDPFGIHKNPVLALGLLFLAGLFVGIYALCVSDDSYCREHRRPPKNH